MRDIETQRKYLATGKSTTMNSKHLKQSDGYSHAVDLYCSDNTGAVTLVIHTMFTVAIELKEDELNANSTKGVLLFHWSSRNCD